MALGLWSPHRRAGSWLRAGSPGRLWPPTPQLVPLWSGEASSSRSFPAISAGLHEALRVACQRRCLSSSLVLGQVGEPQGLS